MFLATSPKQKYRNKVREILSDKETVVGWIPKEWVHITFTDIKQVITSHCVIRLYDCILV